MSINVIELGAGRVAINHGYYGEEAALFIEPVGEAGEIGTDASKSGLAKTVCIEGGTVIILRNLSSAAVLAEELDKAARRIGTRRGMGPIDIPAEG